MATDRDPSDVRLRWSLDAALDDFVIVQHHQLLPDERDHIAPWGSIWRVFPAWGQDEQARQLVDAIRRETTGDGADDLDHDALAAWLDDAFLRGRLVLLRYPKEMPLLELEQEDEVPRSVGDLDGGQTDTGDDPCTKKVFAPLKVTDSAHETITNPPPGPEYDAWRNLDIGWQVFFTVSADRSKSEVRAKVKIKTDGTISDAEKAAWKSVIESAWNNQVTIVAPDPACKAFSGIYDVVIELEYVTSGQDYTVFVMEPDAPAGGGTHGLHGTQNMTHWGRIDTDDVRHEFGHMLGNVEEYFTTNGHDYTEGGKKTGFRDPDGGIMNNPDNPPKPANYEMIRKWAEKAMGGITCTIKAR